jgi:hypothetical protein
VSRFDVSDVSRSPFCQHVEQLAARRDARGEHDSAAMARALIQEYRDGTPTQRAYWEQTRTTVDTSKGAVRVVCECDETLCGCEHFSAHADSGDTTMTAREEMIARNNNAWKASLPTTTPASERRADGGEKSAREEMLERNANAWRQGLSGAEAK